MYAKRQFVIHKFIWKVGFNCKCQLNQLNGLKNTRLIGKKNSFKCFCRNAIYIIKCIDGVNFIAFKRLMFLIEKHQNIYSYHQIHKCCDEKNVKKDCFSFVLIINFDQHSCAWPLPPSFLYTSECVSSLFVDCVHILLFYSRFQLVLVQIETKTKKQD